jgi:hypothetical protein
MGSDMNDFELVAMLKREVIISNFLYYTSAPEERPEDEISVIFHALPENLRGLLAQIIHRVQVDTLSNVLGILDGSSWAEDFKKDFRLHYNDGQNLTGCLQDYFLSDDTFDNTHNIKNSNL